MAARITVTRNFAPLASVQLSTRAVMKEVGLLARERILRRTAAGVDERDTAFAPYSKAYAAAKGSSRVNLQVSGGMLNAIVITELTDASVTLGFSR